MGVIRLKLQPVGELLAECDLRTIIFQQAVGQEHRIGRTYTQVRYPLGHIGRRCGGHMCELATCTLRISGQRRKVDAYLGTPIALYQGTRSRLRQLVDAMRAHISNLEHPVVSELELRIEIPLIKQSSCRIWLGGSFGDGRS